MTSRERQLIVELGQEMRDDINRAERLGRGTVNLAVVKYYANLIEELLEQEDQEWTHK